MVVLRSVTYPFELTCFAAMHLGIGVFLIQCQPSLSLYTCSEFMHVQGGGVGVPSAVQDLAVAPRLQMPCQVCIP